MYFVILSTKVIRWTQAASGTAGRANVGFALHLVKKVFSPHRIHTGSIECTLLLQTS